MAELVQDVRFAIRMLRRGWGVTLIAIGSLAVAIGGNTAVFGLINSLLFQPLSVVEPERLVVLQERRTEQSNVLSTLSTSLPTHADAIVPIVVGDIRRIDAVDGGVAIQVPGRTLELDSTLGEVEGRLDPRDFVRVHRAHLVNLSHVVSVRRYDERRLLVNLDDDSSIIASRRGSQALKERMG